MKNLYYLILISLLICSQLSYGNKKKPASLIKNSTSSLTGFNYVFGNGPSANQSFEVQDELLLTRPYTIIAPSNFEVSTNPTSGFAEDLTISSALISLGSVTVYVRLKSGLSIDYYSGVITITAPEFLVYPAVFDTINLLGECERKSTDWIGSSWNNGIPDIHSIANILENYDTTTYGSINAWELNISSNKTCNIGDSTYIKVQKDIIVNGDFVVESKGALVQVDDSGSFTINSGGTSLIKKTTSPMTNWYDYTYWSSPVNGATASQVFALTPQYRRFWFNAQNYLDILAENNNENTLVSGHDDIDDNGDDWAYVNASDILIPGVGYATTHTPSGFVSGNSYEYVFEGPFNTGSISTPIYYNGDNGDNDWNFIGNPYPCAISADAFFAANPTVVGGAIYLWSHASPPNSENNGNQTYNFNSDDYAIINSGSGEIAGGKPIIPNRYIPSGQGFFVQGLTSDNVVFNNSMRVGDNTSNNQFFRNQNSSNKLWINLLSDNGIFNQTLIAYVDGATDSNDGTSFDTPRNLSTEVAAMIYTIIEDEETDKKYAIQGKASTSLNTNESISLGFYTTIEEATIYTLSIAQFQGAFLNDHDIYLKDNLINVTHNLKDSDYTFTSTAGEFNNRFEVVFDTNTLSVYNKILENDFIIVQLSDNLIKFKANNSQTIQSIKIYDISGKLVYDLKGNNNTETYKLPALNNGIYINKMELDNGKIVTKKMLKKS